MNEDDIKKELESLKEVQKVYNTHIEMLKEETKNYRELIKKLKGDNNNKLEVIITTVVAIVGLVVSVLGMNISNKANEIAEKQTEIAEMQTEIAEMQTEQIEMQTELTELQTEIAKRSILPSIFVEVETEKDDETGNVIDMAIEISNLEGKLNNYKSHIVAYLYCTYGDKEGSYEVEVPVFSYYWDEKSNGENIEGILERKVTDGNWERIQEFQKTIIHHDFKASEMSLHTELYSYLKITYIDLLGEKQSLYYYIRICGLDADIIDIDIIDEENVETIERKIERSNELIREELFIHPYKEIKVNEVIKIIKAISKLDYSENTNEVINEDKDNY